MTVMIIVTYSSILLFVVFSVVSVVFSWREFKVIQQESSAGRSRPKGSTCRTEFNSRTRGRFSGLLSSFLRMRAHDEKQAGKYSAGL